MERQKDPNYKLEFTDKKIPEQAKVFLGTLSN